MSHLTGPPSHSSLQSSSSSSPSPPSPALPSSRKPDHVANHIDSSSSPPSLPGASLRPSLRPVAPLPLPSRRLSLPSHETRSGDLPKRGFIPPHPGPPHVVSSFEDLSRGEDEEERKRKEENPCLEKPPHEDDKARGRLLSREEEEDEEMRTTACYAIPSAQKKEGEEGERQGRSSPSDSRGIKGEGKDREETRLSHLDHLHPAKAKGADVMKGEKRKTIASMKWSSSPLRETRHRQPAMKEGEEEHLPSLSHEKEKEEQRFLSHSPMLRYLCSPCRCVLRCLSKKVFSRSRYHYLFFISLYAFFIGPSYLNWAPLRQVLFRSGAYFWMCDPSETNPESLVYVHPEQMTCKEQRLHVGHLFTLCAASDFGFSFFGGLAMDSTGPKVASLLGSSLMLTGWLLISVSSQSTPLYIPGFILYGLGIDMAFYGTLSVATLFPGHENTVMSIIVAMRALSYMTPVILDSLSSIASSYLPIMLGYALLALLPAVFIALIYAPWRPFPKRTHHQEVEDEKDREQGEKRSSREREEEEEEEEGGGVKEDEDEEEERGVAKTREEDSTEMTMRVQILESGDESEKKKREMKKKFDKKTRGKGGGEEEDEEKELYSLEEGKGVKERRSHKTRHHEKREDDNDGFLHRWHRGRGHRSFHEEEERDKEEEDEESSLEYQLEHVPGGRGVAAEGALAAATVAVRLISGESHVSGPPAILGGESSLHYPHRGARGGRDFEEKEEMRNSSPTHHGHHPSREKKKKRDHEEDASVSQVGEDPSEAFSPGRDTYPGLCSSSSARTTPRYSSYKKREEEEGEEPREEGKNGEKRRKGGKEEEEEKSPTFTMKNEEKKEMHVSAYYHTTNTTSTRSGVDLPASTLRHDRYISHPSSSSSSSSPFSPTPHQHSHSSSSPSHRHGRGLPRTKGIPPFSMPSRSLLLRKWRHMSTYTVSFLKNYMLSYTYLPIIPYFTIALIRSVYFNDSSEDLVPNSLRFLHIILGCVFFAPPFAGLIADYCGIITCMLLVNSFGTFVIVSAFIAYRSHLIFFEYFASLMFMLNMALMTNQVYFYVADTFPQKHLGKLCGFACTIGGVISLCVTKMFEFSVTHTDGFTIMLSLLVGLSTITYLLIGCLYLARRRTRRQEEKKMKRHLSMKEQEEEERDDGQQREDDEEDEKEREKEEEEKDKMKMRRSREREEKNEEAHRHQQEVQNRV
ncbi:transmembrane protein [Cystoisospora suis]|uniref:Transmembrane protein n=1 Tax=Cystoisospora suis TaxID=483139 RepID=A0A2C6LA38_9APIC|nr:transmembrane protein [Cystoisospora suis]